MHQRQHGGIDRDAGLDAARQARRGGQLGDVAEAEMAGEHTHIALAQPGFDERMAHAVLLRRQQAGAILAEIVEIGAGDDLRSGVRPDRPVEAGLADRSNG